MAVFTATGCTTTPAQPRIDSTAATQPLEETREAEATPVDAGGGADGGHAAATPTRLPPPEPALPVPDPESLLGYDDDAIKALLGAPSFARRDPPAELWQYRNDHCTLDLFFYEDPGGTYQVEHLEFRKASLSTEARNRCLRTIIEQNAAAPTSAS